jgi:hypothetical protein
MTESNILPYDGAAILIDDHGAGFDWPAIARTLIDTIPWQIETARIFGREMPIPRMTAWFGRCLFLQRHPSSTSPIPRNHRAPA